MFQLYFRLGGLDFRQDGLDFRQVGLVSGRAVSISSMSENDKNGAVRGAKADSCQGPQPKVKAMPWETIFEK